MKLSNETLAILKNFSTINPSISFKKGNKLATVSSLHNIVAYADIEETIPVDFCIYDLNKFLSLISMLKGSSELEFDDNNVIITGLNSDGVKFK